MRICVYGAGAMGTSLGAYFTRAGVPCDLITRNRAHIAALKQRGAILNGGAPIPVNALFIEEMTGEYDCIFLATKQRDNANTATFLKDYIKADGALVSVQNGLPEEGLAGILGENRVYGCALSWGAEIEEAGKVRLTGGGVHLALGAYGAGDKLNEIAAVLQKIGDVYVGNLLEIRYAKLAINAAFSTLSVISGLTFYELAKKYKGLVLKLLREAFAVAKAAGAKALPLNEHNLFKVFGGFWARIILPKAMKNYRETRSGMLRDLENGKRTDVDFVAGAVVKAGERLNVATPTLKQAVALVHDIENGLAETSPETLRLL